MINVRGAEPNDIAVITGIYRHEVLTGLATFEEDPPDEVEMTVRWRACVDAGLPYLVAQRGGEVLGYAYAGAFRPRPAYRFCVESSVYVHAKARGKGVGRALLSALVARCEAGPWRQMMAVIGDSANAGSIALHTAHGFETRGVMTGVGFKHGVWVDTVVMQRPLGEGDRSLPEG